MLKDVHPSARLRDDRGYHIGKQRHSDPVPSYVPAAGQAMRVGRSPWSDCTVYSVHERRPPTLRKARNRRRHIQSAPGRPTRRWWERVFFEQAALPTVPLQVPLNHPHPEHTRATSLAPACRSPRAAVPGMGIGSVPVDYQLLLQLRALRPASSSFPAACAAAAGRRDWQPGTRPARHHRALAPRCWLCAARRHRRKQAVMCWWLGVLSTRNFRAAAPSSCCARARRCVCRRYPRITYDTPTTKVTCSQDHLATALT